MLALNSGAFAKQLIEDTRVVVSTLRETSTKTLQQFMGHFQYLVVDEAAECTEA
jgi:hypothetical protein